MAQLAKDRVAAANQAVVYAYDQKLIDQRIVSRETNTDKATLDQNQAPEVNLDLANIAQQRALLHGAQVNLGYTKIHSPVNGMVITRYIDVGQTVVFEPVRRAAVSDRQGHAFHAGRYQRKRSGCRRSEARTAHLLHGSSYPNRTFWGSVRQVRGDPSRCKTS